MRSPIVALASLVAFSCCTPTAKNGNVTYYGLYKDRTEQFLGVRFAHDTGGSNRFKAPKPFLPAAGSTVNATTIGPACPQDASSLPDGVVMSEDCLRLNIVRPNGTVPSSKLPVMVYVYGGSFIEGYKDDLDNQPGGLILESVANGHPVIHVAMNYRLGIFGFAKSEALNKEGSENAGLRDQRLALEWVQENIEAFGGDCEKVTIHGQSSGGLAMGMQILAYGGSKPAPFQQAICQSQALEAGITGNFTQLAMKRVLDASHCNGSDAQSATAVSCLRNLNMTRLLDIQTATHISNASANVGDEWLPTVDGDFLPAAPSELVNSGRFNNITAMMGWCQDDANPFANPSSNTTAQDTHDFFRAFLPAFTNANLNKLLELYPVSEFQASHFPNGSVILSAEAYRTGRILRDIVFICQDLFLAEALTKAGNDNYFYDQNQTMLTPLLESEGEYGLGVVHTSEFAYMFGNLSHYNVSGVPYHPTASDFALRDRESRSWSSFAAVGHPSIVGKDTLQGWKKAEFKDETLGVYVIGGPHEGYSGVNGSAATRKLIEEQKLRQRCEFLNSPEVIKQQQY